MSPPRTPATTDLGRSLHRVPQIQIESGSGVKSLDRITNLEQPVYLPKPRKGLPRNVNQSQLRSVLLKAHYV